MKVLELFAGSRSVGKAFERKGHEVFSIDWDENFENIDWCVNVDNVDPDQIIEKFGRPDIIWASPDCTTYSIAAVSHHRERGTLKPKSEYAKVCDRTNNHILMLIELLKPKYFFIENPRGCFRKMNFIKDIPRYTITYCQYGDKRMKPTDIFTNYPSPNFKPMCHNGDNCHESAPRGSKTGTQGLKKIDRSKIPDEFCDYIVKICEKGGIK